MMNMRRMKKLFFAACLCLQTFAAYGAIDAALLKPLAGEDPDARIEAVGKIAALANEDAAKLLQALKDDALYATPDGKVLIVSDDKAYDPASGQTLELPEGIDGITVN